MKRARGVRGIVAGLFVMSTAAAGVGIAAPSAGAGANGNGIRCVVENGDSMGTTVTTVRTRECAQLEVTKVVTGTPAPSPPPGTTFAVVVECVPPENNTPRDVIPPEALVEQQLPQGQSPPFTTTLTFPEGGGTQSVFIAAEAECTASETPPPGCTLTSIDPVTTEIEEPVLYPVTVTNNCDPPVEPAAAVVEEPLFTG